MHDARILTESFIYPDLPGICENGRYHILGDSAYPVSTHLITPYRDNGRLTRIETNFNLLFCGTRVIIENTFCLLKQRFRQLILVDFLCVTKISRFIISCCVLHNLCIDAEDLEEFRDVVIEPEEEHHEPVEQQMDHVRRAGQQKRNMLADYLSHL